MSGNKKPEWASGGQENGFASTIRPGLGQEIPKQERPESGRFIKKNQSVTDIAKLREGLLKGERAMLARSITLVESNAVRHFGQAQSLLQSIMNETGKSVRIGVSGVPGAGKSTFIEAFGTFLCSLGHKVAVLAIDPSSSIGGGSILGDKTRMEELAKNPLAFIRPSPSEGTLGGVHRKTRETMLLCEAAGFDVVIIETVGVGQSEAIVRGMVDFFMLLVLTGAGDELQGMKKGILELTDVIVVNKADGDNKRLAMKTKQEYNQILHFLQPATKGWSSRAITCSSITKEGIDMTWNIIQEFRKITNETGVFQLRRRLQQKEWMHTLIDEQLQKMFYRNENVQLLLPELENRVMSGKETVSNAVTQVFNVFFESIRTDN
ncbi:methylmalonyl Co-A mutase-associated GTPase MeaB [Peribacillus saganii]|uniref:Methylmalonyl Co-A mutase-associated GTPase MeaB n=1 Tax=Peribacillus saganii TaxID=2303992 RepID=A0A372LDP8_9BACI|nr:methylmalonyl Co-A mutase-associated GTPase MeaB [Peribacillus saganii]RFU64224.1 methylmalonyl Co-A mutase-associated GTPase MeaB [Peribacillus saganii]